MLQTRLQSIPIMALLSIREQQTQRSPDGAAAAGAGADAGVSPPGSRQRQQAAPADSEQPLSPTQRQQVAQRGPLIEEKQLVALFRSKIRHPEQGT